MTAGTVVGTSSKRHYKKTEIQSERWDLRARNQHQSHAATQHHPQGQDSPGPYPTAPCSRGLELDDLKCAFQLKPFCDSLMRDSAYTAHRFSLPSSMGTGRPRSRPERAALSAHLGMRVFVYSSMILGSFTTHCFGQTGTCSPYSCSTGSKAAGLLSEGWCCFSCTLVTPLS